MKTISINENCYLIEAFLSDTECNELIAHSERIGYEKAKVNVDGKQVMMTMVRNNERVLEKNLTRADQYWDRLKPIHRIQVGNAVPIGLNELFRYYKYSNNQRFKRHRDGSYERSEKEFSLFTFLIFLNDDFEGGATKFPDHSIIPAKGNALVFKHELRHEGVEVSKGTKYVLRTDIMYRFEGENE